MTPQFTNQLISSFILWLDNLILKKGSAYTNVGYKFYDVSDIYNPYKTYASPFGQFVADSSITGATIISGVYLNNSFLTTGQSGFIGIDYNRGRVYFNTNITGTLSGNYAIKDFNIVLTDKPEEVILFETKYSVRPKTNQTITGLNEDQFNYPIIFVKNNGGQNEPLAFGGMDTTNIDIRLIIMTDSLFTLDAICSILKDSNRLYIPLISAQEMPFNALGGFKSGSYNYNSLISGKIDNQLATYITNVYVSKYQQNTYQEIRNINPTVYTALVDYATETYRFPRL